MGRLVNNKRPWPFVDGALTDQFTQPVWTVRPMGSHNSVVYVVGDDTRVCEAWGELFTFA
jgi:hypothetical protein